MQRQRLKQTHEDTYGDKNITHTTQTDMETERHRRRLAILLFPLLFHECLEVFLVAMSSVFFILEGQPDVLFFVYPVCLVSCPSVPQLHTTVQHKRGVCLLVA